MSYCNPGDKPKITYQFSGSQPVEYLSSTSPIDVSTGTSNPVGTTSNYNPLGYQLVFNSSSYGVFNQTVTDYYTSQEPNPDILQGGTITVVNVLLCGASSFTGAGRQLSAFTIDHTTHCPASSSSNQCQITISSNGNQLFKATGNCPVTFSVACGGRCPDGQCECHSDSYPGYCCQHCGLTAAQIATITAQLKAKNHG
jgi:hypothetical protein